MTPEGRGHYWLERVSGRQYHTLLEWAKPLASVAAVIVRDPERSESPAFVRAATAFALDVGRVTEWPGTRMELPEGDPRRPAMHRFRFPDVCEVVLSAGPDTLYGWREPSFPEDLSLWRADGTVLLGSCAHERFAFLDVTRDELASLSRLDRLFGWRIRASTRKGEARRANHA